MINLLVETKSVLKSKGHKPSDVRWVSDGSPKKFSWDDFAYVADRKYDDGYGGEEVNLRLIIVGDDWWLERHEYDGSEWWEYKMLPSNLEEHAEGVKPKVWGER